MKQFKTILAFELMGYFKNKTFIGVTIFFILVSFVSLSIPRFFPNIFDFGMEEDFSFGSDYDDEDYSDGDFNETILVNLDFADSDYFAQFLTLNLNAQGYAVEISDLSTDEMQDAIANEEYARALYFTSPTEYTNIVLDVALYDFSSSIITDILKSYVQITELEKLGATAEQSAEIMNPIIYEETIQIGKNQMNNFFFTYVLIFVLYIAVLLYGQFVAMSVATEKTSRCMELLVTSAKSTSFIFGKVIGSGIAGLLQLGTILGSVAIAYSINAHLWEDVPIVSVLFDIPAELLVYMLIFFICGFFIYAFLFGAAASFATKVEDINSLVTPIMLCFIVAFLVTMMSLASGTFDNPVLIVCSYIPFTSSMAMFTRVAMDNVPIYEVIISIAILIATTGLCGWFAAKVYRIGVLMYGNKPSFKTVISALKK